nr:unnamed protein product [Callosobruchus analis]
MLKKLQNDDSIDDTTTAVPTMGVNLFSVKVNQKEYQIRELGGTMAPLWPKYYEGVTKVIYVVDASNLCQISAAGVLLYSTLVHPSLQHAKFLLVLTKMDLSYRQMRNEALLMLQMKRLVKGIPQSMTIAEASAITGEGKAEILNWIAK